MSIFAGVVKIFAVRSWMFFWRTIRLGITVMTAPEFIVMPFRNLNQAACWFASLVTATDLSIVFSSIRAFASNDSCAII